MFVGRNENNRAIIMGEIVTPFTFSHEFYGINFYEVYVKVSRRSEEEDRIPVMVSDGLVDVGMDYTGAFIAVEGQYRSYNRRNGSKSSLILSVFAKEVAFTEVEPDASKVNHVQLDGFICKTPVFRKTPLGREITDIILAVNRPYGNTDYIPCIFWGKDAEEAAGWEVGKNIKVNGRIQSRTYIKKLTETESEERVAYEVSVKKMEAI